MMRAIAAVGLLGFGLVAALAQTTAGPPVTIDQINAAMAAATAAQTAAMAAQTAAAAAQAAIPAPCGTAPPADTLLGATGSATPCTPRPDATRPTVVQAAVVTTNTSGAWTVTWAKAFASSTPYINPQAINVSGSQPYICNVSGSTATTAAGQCWQTQTSTLPGVALSLLGLVLNPTSAAASISVRVAARDLTQ